jgi:hypothetical protein
MQETFTWIYNIIDSCHNDFHFDCADVLISLFNIRYGDIEKLVELKHLRQTKWNDIHGILV